MEIEYRSTTIGLAQSPSVAQWPPAASGSASHSGSRKSRAATDSILERLGDAFAHLDTLGYEQLVYQAQLESAAVAKAPDDLIHEVYVKLCFVEMEIERREKEVRALETQAIRMCASYV